MAAKKRSTGRRTTGGSFVPPPLGKIVWYGMILPLVLFFGIATAISIFRGPPKSAQRASPAPTHVEVTLAGQPHHLELALTDAVRTEGLKGRSSMPDNCGMLFVFPDEKIRQFWMQDCLISLDIIFISTGRQIVSIHTMGAPASGVPDRELPVCTSASAAQYVIELNGGRAEQLGLKPGQMLDLPVELLKGIAR